MRELARVDEAETLYLDLLTALRAWSAGNSPELAEALLSYAKQLLLQQRWSEAEGVLREGEAIFVAQGGDSHPRALGTRAELALIQIGQERWLEAEKSLQEVARRRADAGPTQASALAFERAALAYASCRAALLVTDAHVDALRTARGREQDPRCRARLIEADGWLKRLSQRETAPAHRMSAAIRGCDSIARLALRAKQRKSTRCGA